MRPAASTVDRNVLWCQVGVQSVGVEVGNERESERRSARVGFDEERVGMSGKEIPNGDGREIECVSDILGVVYVVVALLISDILRDAFCCCLIPSSLTQARPT